MPWQVWGWGTPWEAKATSHPDKSLTGTRFNQLQADVQPEITPANAVMTPAPPLQHLLVTPMITTIALAILLKFSLLALLAKVQPAKITHKRQRQNCHAVEQHVSQQRLNTI